MVHIFRESCHGQSGPKVINRFSFKTIHLSMNCFVSIPDLCIIPYFEGVILDCSDS